MSIAAKVRHPNLLQFIGATRVGSPIILCELMPTSLRKELETSPLTCPQILRISQDVSSALNYLHLWKPHPILHRDVSSPNVLLEPAVVNGKVNYLTMAQLTLLKIYHQLALVLVILSIQHQKHSFLITILQQWMCIALEYYLLR